MPDLIHQLISQSAESTPNATALLCKDQTVSYTQLRHAVATAAGGLLALGVGPGDRVAVYLPKQFETVYSLFGAAEAGASFVPLNPLLKPRQLRHILDNCGARVLVTSWHRLSLLEDVLRSCTDLQSVVLTDDKPEDGIPDLPQQLLDYGDFVRDLPAAGGHRRIDADLAAILYTSGSTGKAKGVALSHRNLVAGAQSVAGYLGNIADDRLLAVLPLSFDAGLSQLTTAFSVGASVVLLDYLMPRDVVRAVARFGVTGLGAVPPLWNQLRDLPWPEQAVQCLRYLTNTGGAMPLATTRALREALPNTDIFLMYGLTEAFRSTYLPPDKVDVRPDSIGKAVPNADILVVNEDGLECGPNEPGELVHRGALVSMGYWRDADKTAERFRPCPGIPREIPVTELAVWSGDRVRKDEDGYLYFLGREDDMIKTSGYRVSPAEIEEVATDSGLVQQAVALGLPDSTLGQAILLIVTFTPEQTAYSVVAENLMAFCRSELPNYMVPAAIVQRSALPQNHNGKIDRSGLAAEYRDYFGVDSQ